MRYLLLLLLVSGCASAETKKVQYYEACSDVIKWVSKTNDIDIRFNDKDIKCVCDQAYEQTHKDKK